jgi:hypothetical protein
MKEYLIRRSKEATGWDKSWDEATYNSIDWRHHGEVFKKLSNERRIQISKYINDLLPTKQRLATFDNRVDGRCFTCNELWEDTTHVLTCTCDARCEARKAARTIFQQKLTRMHTPDILTNTICNSMDNWLARRPVLPPAWTGPGRNLSSDKFAAPKLRLGGINSSVDVSLRHGANQLARITRSDSLVNHSHRTSGCEQSSRKFGCSRFPYGRNATRNYTALMAPTQWNSGGKTQ